MAPFKPHRNTPFRPVSPTPLDYVTAQLLLRNQHLDWIDARQLVMDIVRENRPDRSAQHAEIIDWFRQAEAQLMIEAL